MYLVTQDTQVEVIHRGKVHHTTVEKGTLISSSRWVKTTPSHIVFEWARGNLIYRIPKQSVTLILGDRG